MKGAWEIWAVATESGNVLADWFKRDKALQARADAILRRLQHMPVWPMPYYRPLGGGVGEIRFDYKKVEHRIYGFFATGKWVALLGVSGKKNQNEHIKHAKKLKKQFDAKPWKTEKYDV